MAMEQMPGRTQVESQGNAAMRDAVMSRGAGGLPFQPGAIQPMGNPQMRLNADEMKVMRMLSQAMARKRKMGAMPQGSPVRQGGVAAMLMGMMGRRG